MEKVRENIGAFIYVMLPLLLMVSPYVFIVGVLVSTTMITLQRQSYSESVFKIAVCTMCFTSISVFSMKLFDIVIMISMFGYIIVSRKIIINSNVIWIVPFFIFIVIQTVVNVFMLGTNGLESITELGRYFLALITLFVFMQVRLKGARHIGQVVRWLDHFVLLEIVQTIIMLIIQSKGLLNETYSAGPFLIAVFTDANELRGTALFSDPNKLMTFFFMLLVVRLVLNASSEPSKINLTRQSIFYFLGAIMTFARTAVIATLVCLTFFIFFRMFGRHIPLAYAIATLVLGIGALLVINYREEILNISQNLFAKILSMMGRENTLAIDTSFSTDGRVRVWQVTMRYIKLHPIFGNGLLSEERLLPIPTHNTFMQMMLDVGLIGSILYFIGICKMIMVKIPGWVVFATMFIPMFFLDLGNYRMIFIIAGLAVQAEAFSGEYEKNYSVN